MRSRILLLIVFSLIITGGLFASSIKMNSDEYIVQAGDVFSFQVIGIDTLSVLRPVLPAGNISLYPITGSVDIAGLSLTEAISKMNEAVRKSMRRGGVEIQLVKVAPYHYNVIGDIPVPGDYIAKEPITLFLSLQKAGGLLSNASKRIDITRKGITKTYDLNQYFEKGDLEQNPLIMPDDVIFVTRATNAIKVYANNDTLNYVENIETETALPIETVLKRLQYKNRTADYENISIYKGNTIQKANLTDMANPGDRIMVSLTSSFVYVSGNVTTPGRFPINGNSPAQYYIGLAGGIKNEGGEKIFIIHPNGDKEEYKNQSINDGDILYIPQSTPYKIVSYLQPISLLLTIITSTIYITK